MVAPELIGTLPSGREIPLGKYDRRRGPATDKLIAAHLAGEITLAAPGIGADGLARMLALDVDQGGAVKVEDCLAAIMQMGLKAFAELHTTPGGHDGGHVRVFFADGVTPERLRALGRRILDAARLPSNTEIWPSEIDLRLPLGVHRHTGRRGEAVALGDTIEPLDLNRSADLARALALLPELVNPVDLVPELPAPAPVAPATAPLPRGAGGGKSLIDHANRMSRDAFFDLVTSYPGYRRRGKAISCGCGHHSRGDRTPSLDVIEGRNGKPLLRAYSPSCAHYLPEGYYHDPVSFVAAVEGVSQIEAARRILGAPEAAPRAHNYPTAPTADGDRRHTDPAQVAARAAEAARKREARRVAAEANREGARARACEDPYLIEHPTVREVLKQLFFIAGGKDWCRPSVAQLAELVKRSERTVQRALEWLEGRYIVTEVHERDGQRWRGSTPTNPRATARRTFLRETLQGVETPQTAETGVTPRAPFMSPDHVVSSETHDRPDPWEGGVSAPRGGEPADWEVWEFDPSSDHEPEELAALDLPDEVLVEPEPAQAVQPVEAPAAREPEAVFFASGVSFDPFAPPQPPRDLRRIPNWLLLIELCPGQGAPTVASPVVEVAGDEVEAGEEPEVRGPPRDPARAAHYWKLRGKAKKATSAKQKRYLLGLAAELEEWYPASEAARLYLRPDGISRPHLQMALDAAKPEPPTMPSSAPTAVPPPSHAHGRADAATHTYWLPDEYDRAGLASRIRALARASPIAA